MNRRDTHQTTSNRKDYYDRKVKESQFEPGNWVWYLYPRRRVGKSPKWQKYYTGPYLVTRLLPPNDVVLQKTKKSKSFVAHRDKVKLFHGKAPESWLNTHEPVLTTVDDHVIPDAMPHVENKESCDSDQGVTEQ